MKKVYQYSRDGTFLREFRNSRVAERVSKVAAGSIRRCALHYEPESESNQVIAGNYIWSYRKADSMPPDFRKKKPRKPMSEEQKRKLSEINRKSCHIQAAIDGHKIKVIAYDKEGDLIFDSMSDCARHYGVKPSTVHSRINRPSRKENTQRGNLPFMDYLL